jgi:hypothetical protein
MELKEFVKDVLIQLDQAVDEARASMSRDVSFVGTENQRVVEFDIAVTVESAAEKTGGGGIKVLELIKAEGKISSENKNSSVSRIKFGIRIDSVTKAESARLEAEIRDHNEAQRQSYGL